MTLTKEAKRSRLLNPVYKREYCERIIEHMAEGYTMESFAAVVDIAPSHFKNWERDHPEFADAVRIGKQECSKTWQTILKDNAESGKGNATCTVFGLKNYDPENFKDKSQIENTGNIVWSIDTGIPPKTLQNGRESVSLRETDYHVLSEGDISDKSKEKEGESNSPTNNQELTDDESCLDCL